MVILLPQGKFRHPFTAREISSSFYRKGNLVNLLPQGNLVSLLPQGKFRHPFTAREIW
jgi:hypothetical protein